MSKTIRIGTRDSNLALWQARFVQQKLESLGYNTQIVPVKSEGDVVLDKPLYEFGITGIFTKTLDVAMITNQVDIAVHSMKDVPTQLPYDILQSAVLPRANHQDILVSKHQHKQLPTNGTIATGSLRRQAQWLHHFPEYQTTDLRGNVNTRLQKTKQADWVGAIFAKAGLERLNFTDNQTINSSEFNGYYQTLDWMIPAPAQGAMLVVCKKNDAFCFEATQQLNDTTTEICTHIERQFLRALEGGCTAPIGCFAQVVDDNVLVKAGLFSLNGKKAITAEKEFLLHDHKTIGTQLANYFFEQGAREILDELKK